VSTSETISIRSAAQSPAGALRWSAAAAAATVERGSAACRALPQGLWFSRLLNLFGDKEARILVGAGALAAGGMNAS